MRGFLVSGTLPMERGSWTVEQVDLTSLEVLGMAVKAEIESAQLYHMMSKRVKNRVVRSKLAFLEGEEEKHRALLEDLYAKTFPQAPLSLPETSPIPPVTRALKKELTLKKLFQVAMEAEQKSEAFYAHLAAEIKDPTGKSMLSYLSQMERGHYQLLKGEYEVVVAYPDYFDKEEFLFGDHMIHLGP